MPAPIEASQPQSFPLPIETILRAKADEFEAQGNGLIALAAALRNLDVKGLLVSHASDIFGSILKDAQDKAAANVQLQAEVDDLKTREVPADQIKAAEDFLATQQSPASGDVSGTGSSAAAGTGTGAV